MPNRADLLEALAVRVEAEGSDRALDAEIYAEFEMMRGDDLVWDARPSENRPGMVICYYNGGTHGTCVAPALTSSLDAVKRRMPDGWRVVTIGETPIEGEGAWVVRLSEGEAGFGRGEVVAGRASTEACARLAACLRAHVIIERKKRDG